MASNARLAKGTAVALLAATVAFIGAKEGMRTVAYRDVVGIPTICFGETRGVKMGDRKTVDQCRAMLSDRLIEFSAGVDSCMHREVADKTYEAMVSLAYNIGVGGFCKSSIVRSANAGDLIKACQSFSLYDRAGKKVVRGLTARRAEERALCLSGIKGV